MTVALAAALCAVGVAEVGVRVSGIEARWIEPLIPRQGADPTLHRASTDPEIRYELVPSGRLVGDHLPPYGDRERVVTTNALGFRDLERTVEKAPGTLRVLCLGGSNTYGAVVADANTWPRRLEAVLADRMDLPVEVWNLGVSGYVTRQKVALAARALREYDPDLLIVQLHNRGPRYFSADQAVPPRADVHREFMPGVPEGGVAAFAYDLSVLSRLVVLARARRARAEDVHAYGSTLSDPADPLDARLLAKFAANTPVPVVAFHPVAPPGDHRAPGHLSFVDMGPRPPPHGRDEEARHIHPGAEIHGWYADVLAQELLAGDCLRGVRCRIPSPR